MMRKRVRSPPPRDNHPRYSPPHGSRYRLGRYNQDLDANEYRSRRVDEDRDHQARDMMMIHGLGEAERINSSNSSYGRSNVLEYGGSSEKDYQDSRRLGGTMLEKPIYPKTALYTLQSANKRSYKDIDNYSPLNKFSDGLQKNEQLRLHGDLSPEKVYGGDRDQSYSRHGQVPNFYSKDDNTRYYSRKEDNRRPYLTEDKSQLYSGEENPRSYSIDDKPYLHYRERESQLYFKNSLNHEKPSSQYKVSTADPFGSSVDDLSRSFKNNFLVGSDGYNRHLIDSLPTENLKPFLEDATNHRKDKLSPNIDYCYSTNWRSDYTKMVPLPDKPFGKLSDVRYDYCDKDPLGSRIMDPILNECSSHRENLNEARLWDDRRSSPGRLVSNYSDAPRSSYTVGSDLQASGRREIDLVYEGENYRSNKKTSSGEHYGYRQGKGLQPHEERTKSYLREEVYQPHENRSSREDYDYGQVEGLQPRNGRRISYFREDYDYGRPKRYMSKDCDHVYDRVDQICDGSFNNSLERVKVEDVGRHRRSNDVSTRRCDISERLSIGRKLSTKAHNNRANKSLLGGSRYQNPWVSKERVFPGKSNAYTFGGRSTGKARASNPGVRDIKKRLGPSRPVKYIAVKNQRNRKIVTKSEDGDGEGSVQAEEEGLSDKRVETATFEPPENSDEFKQMVRSAFFKFVKQLNENMVDVRKFNEQGKAGSLKCWVCGSGSEDFSDTESLVKHACTESRVGYRAQHLGFQKALCALMGWKAAEIHDNEWVREVLSVAETSSQNEDLILWPPLVVVHNSSFVKNNPARQVAVSVEGLQTMIQDMGFSEKAKVCPGTPENQSIIVIKFSATYSGFLEAVRLHKLFADNKHGRTQFQKIESEGSINRDGKPNIFSAESMRDVLYGFLGIGSDLNKLDSETKKRCVVRRKKEIQDLGDAPLKAE